MRIGGSTKGSAIEFGDYGLRLKDDGQRMSAKQLQTAEAVIKRIIKAVPGSRVWVRVATNIPVCTKGNETRMGKGKGNFDFWACRIPTGKVIFEVGGNGLHEAIAREALRQAGDKLPGKHEFIVKGSLPRVGIHQAVSENLQRIEQRLEDVHIS